MGRLKSTVTGPLRSPFLTSPISANPGAESVAIVRLPDAYLVQAAMPSGINSLVIAHAYGLDLRLTSAVLAWSTGLVVAVALAASAL